MGRPKNKFKRCSRCKVEISREQKASYCEVCNKLLNRFNTYINKKSLENNYYNNKMKKHLHEFVDRLEARKEMASIEEIFVELITLHNHFTKDNDTMREESAQTQIPRMWKTLKSISEKIKT
jgi:hypothetical protein